MTIGRKCSTAWIVSKYRVFLKIKVKIIKKNSKQKQTEEKIRYNTIVSKYDGSNLHNNSFIPKYSQNVQLHKQSIRTVLVVAVAVKMNNKKLRTKPKLREV